MWKQLISHSDLENAEACAAVASPSRPAPEIAGQSGNNNKFAHGKRRRLGPMTIAALAACAHPYAAFR